MLSIKEKIEEARKKSGLPIPAGLNIDDLSSDDDTRERVDVRAVLLPSESDDNLRDNEEPVNLEDDDNDEDDYENRATDDDDHDENEEKQDDDKNASVVAEVSI